MTTNIKVKIEDADRSVRLAALIISGHIPKVKIAKKARQEKSDNASARARTLVILSSFKYLKRALDIKIKIKIRIVKNAKGNEKLISKSAPKIRNS